MDDRWWHFVGHEVDTEALGLIRDIVGRFGGLGREELAETVCELLAWTRPTGRLKGRECREFLERLDAAGVVTSPALDEGRRQPRSLRSPELSDIVDVFASCQSLPQFDFPTLP